MLLLYPYNKLPFSATNYGHEFFTFIFWTPIKWLSWLLINSHYYVLKKQVIFGRFTFSPHVKTQDVSMFGERECLGNSWSFLVGRHFLHRKWKCWGLARRGCENTAVALLKISFFFFKSTIYKNFSEKKKTFVGPSSSESLMNDVRKITAGMRCFIKERYCVAVWKEERGAVGGEESASWRAHFNLSSAQPFEKVNIERGAA